MQRILFVLEVVMIVIRCTSKQDIPVKKMSSIDSMVCGNQEFIYKADFNQDQCELAKKIEDSMLISKYKNYNDISLYINDTATIRLSISPNVCNIDYSACIRRHRQIEIQIDSNDRILIEGKKTDIKSISTSISKIDSIRDYNIKRVILELENPTKKSIEILLLEIRKGIYTMVQNRTDSNPIYFLFAIGNYHILKPLPPPINEIIVQKEDSAKKMTRIDSLVSGEGLIKIKPNLSQSPCELFQEIEFQLANESSHKSDYIAIKINDTTSLKIAHKHSLCNKDRESTRYSNILDIHLATNDTFLIEDEISTLQDLTKKIIDSYKESRKDFQIIHLTWIEAPKNMEPVLLAIRNALLSIQNINAKKQFGKTVNELALDEFQELKISPIIINEYYPPVFPKINN